MWGCDERRTKESTESCVEANALHNISVDSFVIIIIKDDECFLSFIDVKDVPLENERLSMNRRNVCVCEHVTRT